MKLVGPRSCGKTKFAHRAIIADVRIDESELDSRFNYKWLQKGVKTVIVDNWSDDIDISELLKPKLLVNRPYEETVEIVNEITWILICQGEV